MTDSDPETAQVNGVPEPVVPAGSGVIADYGPDEDATDPSETTSLTDPVTTVRRDASRRETFPGS
ncbi:MAG: hypothetical protein ACR2MN_01570 [Acidimicrobiales bacterium]